MSKTKKSYSIIIRNWMCNKRFILSRKIYPETKVIKVLVWPDGSRLVFYSNGTTQVFK